MPRGVLPAILCALLLACSSPENAPEKRDANFQFSQLTTSRVAVWPIQNLNADLGARKVIQAEFGEQEAFLKAFSAKLSGRLVPLGQSPSLDSAAVTGILSATPGPLDAGSLLKSRSPALAQLPGLRGVK